MMCCGQLIPKGNVSICHLKCPQMVSYRKTVHCSTLVDRQQQISSRQRRCVYMASNALLHNLLPERRHNDTSFDSLCINLTL